jgi:hypothetical protein
MLEYGGIMSEQVHPYCRCLYYAANVLARNISQLSEDAFACTGSTKLSALGFSSRWTGFTNTDTVPIRAIYW